MVGGTTFDEAFTRWGTAMRKYHGKSLNTPKDVAREYLGEWTAHCALKFAKKKEQFVGIRYVCIFFWHFFPKVVERLHSGLHYTTVKKNFSKKRCFYLLTTQTHIAALFLHFSEHCDWDILVIICPDAIGT